MFPTENLVKKVTGKKKKKKGGLGICLLAASHTADEGSRFTRLKPWKTVECGTRPAPHRGRLVQHGGGAGTQTALTKPFETTSVSCHCGNFRANVLWKMPPFFKHCQSLPAFQQLYSDYPGSWLRAPARLTKYVAFGMQGRTAINISSTLVHFSLTYVQ